MRHTLSNPAFSVGLIMALACAASGAQADDRLNTLKLGVAHIGFNTKSGDLSGPVGTTPPGVKAELNDASTLALVYSRHLSGPWSVVLQAGTPPVIKLDGAGTAAALGQVGTTRAWFPAALANYTFDGPWGLQPYVGAGVNYTFYTQGHVEAAYTAAFGGTSSSAKLKSSWGPVWKVGVGVPLGQNWVLDAAYSRYGIRTTATITTATPGVGDIARTIDVRSDPDVLGLLLGYRF